MEDTWTNALLFKSEIDPFVEWLKAGEQWDGIAAHYRIGYRKCLTLDSDNDPALAEWASRFIFLGAVTRAFSIPVRNWMKCRYW